MRVVVRESLVPPALVKALVKFGFEDLLWGWHRPDRWGERKLWYEEDIEELKILSMVHDLPQWEEEGG